MKKILVLLSTLLILGCGNDPSPQHTETRPADALTTEAKPSTSDDRTADSEGATPDAANRRIASPADSGELRPRSIGQQSEPDQLYQRFREAQEQTIGLQSALASMEPYLEMVLSGHTLMEKYPGSAQYQALQAEFQDALTTFLDIHIREADGYPLYQCGFPLDQDEANNTEVETHLRYLEDNPQGPYAPIITRMLDDMSQLGPRPENLYVIAAGEFMSQDSAQDKQFDLLQKGEDVLHILPFDAGKAEPRYLLAYRFFENEEVSLEFLSELMKRSKLAPQYLMMSCRRGKLYQLGI